MRRRASLPSPGPVSADGPPFAVVELDSQTGEAVPVRGESLTTRARAARALALTLAFCVAASALVWFFDSTPAASGSQAITVSATAKGPAPRLGSIAPDFQLMSLDGEVIDLQSFRGEPVWITFWASWCPPCRAESPELAAAYERHAPDGLVILAINVGEDPSAAAAYVEKAGLPFPVGLDRSTAVAAQYRVQGLPTHYFVDSAGVIRDMKIGPMGTKEIERRLAKVLEAP